MKKQILDKIKEIKKMYGRKPQCYLVAIILSSNFKGEIWYNSGHCLVEIDGDFYDKRGMVKVEEFENGNYLPINQFGIHIESSLIEAMVESIKN
ncbi:hypothetical protein PANI_CDS0051 [Maribacter phage Panino]